MGHMVKLTLFIELDHDTAKQGHSLDIVRILIFDFFESFIALVEVVLIKELFCLNEPDIKRILLIQHLNY